MMLGPVHIEQPAWLLIALLALPLLRAIPTVPTLPGAWSAFGRSDLRSWLLAWVPETGQERRRKLVFTLFCLLALALASIGFGTNQTALDRALHGRMLVIDASTVDTARATVFAARQLVAASAGVPTGVVVVAGDAFDVVPITADPAQLERYLRVIDPAIMPAPGRELGRGIARAMATLERSRLAATQIVLLTHGSAPDVLPTLPRLSEQLTIITSDPHDASWQRWAAHLDAGVSDSAIYPQLNASLDARRSEAVANATPVEQRRGLTPWFLIACLPLWLIVFFSPQAKS